ncbi:MAG: hypothetical protein AABY16_01445 [Nanoarchaeota archaeon]
MVEERPKREDFVRAKKIVKRASEGVYADYGNRANNLTSLLANSDALRKKGRIKESFEVLERAYNKLEEDGQMSGENREKYVRSIFDRAHRILTVTGDDEDTDMRAHGLIERIDFNYSLYDSGASYKANKHRKLWSIITPVCFVLSLFFLSSNITGNVIGNASLKVSNLVGALFFLVGLLGAWSWVRNR